MTEQKPPRDPLAALFRDVVLVLGGVFAIENTDDKTVRRAAAGLERVWVRARSGGGHDAAAPTLSPHPSIAALLRLIEEER